MRVSGIRFIKWLQFGSICGESNDWKIEGTDDEETYMTKVSFYDNFDGVETFGKLFFAEIHTFEKNFIARLKEQQL